MNKQSDWIFDLLNKTAKLDIEQFLDGTYDGYEYGKPTDAAKALIEKTKILDGLLDSMQKDLDLAGQFLEPGMRASLLKDIKRMIVNHFEK